MHRPRLARVLAGLFGTLVAFGVLRGALAEGANDLSFSWDAPPECPDEGYVRGAIDRLLTGGPRTSTRVDARAHVTRTGTSWRVTLTTAREGASGRREVEANSCRSLADATALIVALTIDPARVAANRPEPAEAASLVDGGMVADSSAPSDATPTSVPEAAATATGTPVPPGPPPAVTPDAGPSRSPSSARVLEVHGAVLALLGGDRGTLPNTAYGVTLGGALLLGPVRFEAYGSYWPPQDAHSAPGEGGGVRLYAGGLRAGYALKLGGVELMPGLGFEGGILYAQGFGALSNGSARGQWLALTGDARASVRLAGRLRLVVDLGVGVPFRRDSFFLGVADTSGAVKVHEAFWIVGRGFVGPEVRF